MALRNLSIRTQLTLWYVALLGVLLIAFSIALYVLVAHALYQQVDDTLVRSAEQIDTSPPSGAGKMTVTTFVVDPATINLVRDGSMTEKAFTAAQPITNVHWTAVSPQPVTFGIAGAQIPTSTLAENGFTTLIVEGQAYRIYNVSSAPNAASVQVVQSLTPVQQTLQQLALALGIVIPTTLGIASVGGMWFARRALKPVDQITRAAQELSVNDLHQRLQLQLPDDEIGRLARTFDDMLARLDDAFQRERDFTSNASHELRTPLTAMRGEIQVALQRTRTPEEYRGVLQRLESDVHDLSKTVNDLLLLARADARRAPIEMETLDAALMLDAVRAAWLNMAQEKDIALVINAPAQLHLIGNEVYFLRAVGNLIENALKFSEPHTTITLTAARANGHVEFTIADQGIGIAAEQLPHIFERFYRAGDGRAPGTGLGLPLAQALIAAQGGEIFITSVEGKGTSAHVKMKGL